MELMKNVRRPWRNCEPTPQTERAGLETLSLQPDRIPKQTTRERRRPEEPDAWSACPVLWEGSQGDLGPLPDTRASRLRDRGRATGA